MSIASCNGNSRSSSHSSLRSQSLRVAFLIAPPGFQCLVEIQADPLTALVHGLLLSQTGPSPTPLRFGRQLTGASSPLEAQAQTRIQRSLFRLSPFECSSSRAPALQRDVGREQTRHHFSSRHLIHLAVRSTAVTTPITRAIVSPPWVGISHFPTFGGKSGVTGDIADRRPEGPSETVPQSTLKHHRLQRAAGRGPTDTISPSSARQPRRTVPAPARAESCDR